MKIIVIREMKNYIKNPIYWVGMVILILSIWGCLKPYLEIDFIKSESQLENQKKISGMDADVMEGYIPVSEKQQLETGLNKVKESFVQYYEMDEKEAQRAIEDVKAQNLCIEETVEYLKEQYGYYDGKAVFLEAKYQKGNMEEVNRYIEDKLDEHSYAHYFAKKYADFAGLHFAFYACILLAFLYIRDMRKDTYELLHTKSVSGSGYIWGKFFGGLSAMLLALIIITIVFSGICLQHTLKMGETINIGKIFVAAFLYVVPTLVIVAGIYTMIALVFRNPLPALPLVVVYIIYSNMGSYDNQGNYGFYGQIFGMLFRFEGKFFETYVPAIYRFNQIALIGLTAILVFIAIRFWKRRRFL